MFAIINLQQRQNAWHQWIDLITTQRMMALSKAAIVMAGGNVVAASNDFYLSTAEINAVKQQFDMFDQPLVETDKLRIKNTTYVVKERSQQSLAAFNGHKYLLVTRSAKNTLIVTVCTSRAKCEAAKKWLLQVPTAQLSKRNY